MNIYGRPAHGLLIRNWRNSFAGGGGAAASSPVAAMAAARAAPVVAPVVPTSAPHPNQAHCQLPASTDRSLSFVLMLPPLSMNEP
jgi:hypothetical protein